ncbi:hypothetical protein IP86_10895 [Rhodopseudomonas sp. AAP120]|uniref:hypothetical protein n=1 Tax=Rhodopseudomonas sp. AAP120 TaxID=1523430 RepID=UPI0006B8F7B7|nr:hypothetical protein [Rhodopseudomonas sp. AAP120]KPF98823.1 hypothetical protein IP86_10895 [Rhodopseudomonas sp. AAP120]
MPFPWRQDEWIREVGNVIVRYYGEEARERAEQFARNSLYGYAPDDLVKDDPTAEAVLIMEGWSYAEERR